MSARSDIVTVCPAYHLVSQNAKSTFPGCFGPAAVTGESDALPQQDGSETAAQPAEREAAPSRASCGGGRVGLSPRWHSAEGPWKVTACLGWHAGEVAMDAQSLWRWCVSVSPGAAGLGTATAPSLKQSLGWRHSPFAHLLLWDSLQLVLSEQGDAERQQPGRAARKGRKVALAVHQQLRPWLKPPQRVASVSLRVTLKSPSLLSRSPACWGKWLNQSTETCCSSASQDNRGLRCPVPRTRCGLASAPLPWFGLWVTLGHRQLWLTLALTFSPGHHRTL